VTVVVNGQSYGTLSQSGDRASISGISNGDDIRLIYYYEGGSHQVEHYTYQYASNIVEFNCDPASGQLVVSSSADTSDCEYSSIQTP
jgi:hypothetical protein